MNRIVLVGYRGTGKTTVGRELASRLGWAFTDNDDLIEAQANKTIAEIFRTEGEAGFRQREELALAEALQQSKVVVATGGGAVTREANRERIKTAGSIVWLTAEVDTILARMATDTTTAARRPNLTTGGRVEVETLLAVRQPLYASVASCQFATDNKPIETIVNEILCATAKVISGGTAA